MRLLRGRVSSTIGQSPQYTRALGAIFFRSMPPCSRRGQRIEVDRAVAQRDAVVGVHHRERVLAPVLVVAVGEVLAGVGAAALLPRLGADDGGERVRDQVGELERLHQVGVPDHRAVGDLDVGHLVGDLVHRSAALLQHLGGAEDRGVRPAWRAAS